MTFSYKSQTSSQLNSIINVDDDDLDFDLDDDNVNNNTKPTKRSNSDDTSPISLNQTKSNSSITIEKQSRKSQSPILSDNSPENVFKKPKYDSFLSNSFEKQNQSLLELFETNTQAELQREQQEQQRQDEEKRQYARSSTQINKTYEENNESDVYECNESLFEVSGNESIIIQKYDQDKAKDTIWQYAKEHLIEMCQKLNVDRNILQKYSIKNYINKFYKYNLLKSQSQNKISRIPFVYGYIKTILIKSTNATVLLAGDNCEIMCSLSTSFMKKYSDLVKVGTVLVLQDVCFVRVSLKKDGNHLNVNIDNLISIYYLNIDVETNSAEQQIDIVNIKNINPIELRDKIKLFENIFHIDKDNINESFKRPLSVSNQQVRPNVVPPRPQPQKPPSYSGSSRPTYQNNNSQIRPPPTVQQTRPATESSVSKPNNPVQQTRPNSVTPSSKPNNISNVNNNPQKRNFNFNKPPAPSGDQNKQPSNDLVSRKNQNEDLTTLSSQTSEEIFSQLIFGIEDEFLQDDD